MWLGCQGSIRTLGGIDSDPASCADFERFTGIQATCLDLFDREQYVAFHGKQPPPEWREATPADVLRAAGGICPNIIFSSPPCKGFSGLLPAASAGSEKYQALNRLTTRAVRLTLEAFRKDPPAVFLIENVPRIRTRGAELLEEIKRLLRGHGYRVTDSDHDCGEIGGLGQRRKRYLMIARNPKKLAPFIYQPPKRPLKTIGDVIGPLALPDDPSLGPMHRLPRLKWLTWLRLALIPAGGDWRDLQKITPEEYRIVRDEKNFNGSPGLYGVNAWDEPAKAVTGGMRVPCSNTPAAIADPRLPNSKGIYPNRFKVNRFDEPAPTITGDTDVQCGAQSIGDPRLHHVPRPGVYRVLRMDEASPAVTGGAGVGTSNGPQAVADHRFGCKPRGNTKGPMGVQSFDEPAATVFGSLDVHSGPGAVSDPRIPGNDERPDPPPVIVALDGTWHRPLTTLELLALQSFPVRFADGSPVVLAGKSDSRWRERVGNAVPPDASRGIHEQILLALIQHVAGETFVMGSTEIWVRREEARRLIVGRI
jgi:site-specific DNA-cytosine methylase